MLVLVVFFYCTTPEVTWASQCQLVTGYLTATVQRYLGGMIQYNAAHFLYSSILLPVRPLVCIGRTSDVVPNIITL